ncbi:hypothetical protein AAFG13_35690 [Bradyrhizobium sp. B124]|uniref:hypothetical protein n=1 Tax=Bradyrhizobium sp. B124 TaxID=3140245 RepID=UPI0031838D1C
MLNEDLARIRAHRNNSHRYRRLLRTKLSELERQFIERRLAKEQTALDALAAATFPVTFTLPKGQASATMGPSDERRPRPSYPRRRKGHLTPSLAAGECQGPDPLCKR